MTLSEISPPGPNDNEVRTRPLVREGDDVVRTREIWGGVGWGAGADRAVPN